MINKSSVRLFSHIYNRAEQTECCDYVNVIKLVIQSNTVKSRNGTALHDKASCVFLGACPAKQRTASALEPVNIYHLKQANESTSGLVCRE